MKGGETFVNEYSVTWPLFRRAAFRESLRGPRLIMTVLWAVLAAASLAAYLLFGNDHVIFSLVLFAFCVYNAVFNNILRARLQYDAIAEKAGEKGWKRVVSFSEDGISVSEAGDTRRYGYAELTAVRETDDLIFLSVGKSLCLPLVHSAFGKHGWEECRNMLEQRQAKKPGLREAGRA